MPSHTGRHVYPCASAIRDPAWKGGHVFRQSAPVKDFVVRLVIARLSRPDAADCPESVGHLRLLCQAASRFLPDQEITPEQEPSHSRARQYRSGLEGDLMGGQRRIQHHRHGRARRVLREPVAASQ